MKKVYFLLTVLGLFLPLSQFVLWLNKFGVYIPLFISTISEDRLSLLAWLDVIIFALASMLFILYKGGRLSMPRLFLTKATTLYVKISFCLPLFLLLREHHIEAVR